MKVAIVMGSDSDLEIMKEAVDTLEKMGIGSFVSITSAHRTPDKVGTFLKDVEKNGCEVIIAGAGMAAHLAGVIAANTILPVIGVPMPGGALNGADALYSTVQMPGGDCAGGYPDPTDRRAVLWKECLQIPSSTNAIKGS